MSIRPQLTAGWQAAPSREEWLADWCGWAALLVAMAICTASEAATPRWQDDPVAQSTDWVSDRSAIDRGVEVVGDLEGVQGLVLVRSGRIVAQHYWRGGSRDRLQPVGGITESIVAILTGIASAEGFLEPEDFLATRYPSHAFNADPLKRSLQISHLLSMTSGLDPVSFAPDGPWVHSPNWVDAVLTRRLNDAPGARYEKNPGASHVLSALLTRVVGRSTKDYALARLFSPIGVREVTWSADSLGVTMGERGLQLRAGDLARLGQLYLDDGVWGERMVVPPTWVRASTQAQSPTEDPLLGRYGFGWWVKGERFLAMGEEGQLLLVAPDADAVVVVVTDDSRKPAPWRERLLRTVQEDLLTGLAPFSDTLVGENAAGKNGVESASTPNDPDLARLAERIDILAHITGVEPHRRYITSAKVNFRKGPDLDAKRIGTLAAQTEVELLERRGVWLNVRVGHDEGWLHADYASPLGDTAALNPSALERKLEAIAGSLKGTANTEEEESEDSDRRHSELLEVMQRENTRLTELLANREETIARSRSRLAEIESELETLRGERELLQKEAGAQAAEGETIQQLSRQLETQGLALATEKEKVAELEATFDSMHRDRESMQAQLDRMRSLAAQVQLDQSDLVAQHEAQTETLTAQVVRLRAENQALQEAITDRGADEERLHSELSAAIARHQTEKDELVSSAASTAAENQKLLEVVEQLKSRVAESQVEQLAVADQKSKETQMLEAALEDARTDNRALADKVSRIQTLIDSARSEQVAQTNRYQLENAQLVSDLERVGREREALAAAVARLEAETEAARSQRSEQDQALARVIEERDAVSAQLSETRDEIGALAAMLSRIMPQATREETLTLFETIGAVNFRDQPDITGRRLALLEPGRALRVVGETDAWLNVVIDDQTGWIHRDYARPVVSTAAVSESATLREQVAAFEAVFTGLYQELDHLRGALEATTEERAAQSVALQSARDETEVLQSEVVESEQALLDAKRLFAEKLEKLEVVFASVKSTYQQELTGLDTSLQDALIEVTRLSEANALLRGQVEGNEALLAELQSERDQRVLAAEQSNLQLVALNKTLDDERQKFETLSQAYDLHKTEQANKLIALSQILQRERARVEQVVANQEKLAAGHQATVATLEKTLASERDHLAKVQSDKESLVQAFAEERLQRESAFAEQRAMVERLTSTQAAERETAAEKIALLSSALESHRSDLAELEAQRTRQQQEHLTELEKVTAELADRDTRLAGLEARLAETNGKLSSAMGEVRDTREGLESTATAIAELAESLGVDGPATGRRVILSPVNFRKAPDLSSDIIGLVEPGSVVTVLERSDGWLNAEIGSVRGWLHGDFSKPAQATGDSLALLASIATLARERFEDWRVVEEKTKAERLAAEEAYSELESLRMQSEALSSEKSRLLANEERNLAIQRAAAEEIERLRHALGEAESLAGEQVAENSEALAALQAERDSLREERDRAGDELQVERQAVLQAREEATRVGQLLAETQQNYSETASEKEARLEELETQVGDLIRERDLLAASEKELIEKLARTPSGDQESEVERLRTQLSEVVTEKDNRIAVLERQVEVASSEKERLSGDLDRIRAEHQSQQESVELLVARQSEIVSKFQELRDLLRVLEAERDALKRANGESHEQIASLKTLNETITAQLQDKDFAIASLESDLTRERQRAQAQQVALSESVENQTSAVTAPAIPNVASKPDITVLKSAESEKMTEATFKVNDGAVLAANQQYRGADNFKLASASSQEAQVAGNSVAEFLKRWSSAWSAGDVEAYLSLYSQRFEPEGGLSRSEWEDQRSERLRKPAFIKVTVADLKVLPINENKLRATFEQSYRADHYEDKVIKTLELARTESGWRIVRETSD